MPYPFKNLIFEGGGVKGIAYVGALRELKKRGILGKIKRVGGTSAGAINAVLLAVNYTPADMQRILADLNFKSFMDSDWGVIRDTQRVIREFGWYKGDFFHEWVGNLIRKKTGNRHSTFNDLRNLGYLDLYLIGANLSTGYAEVFSPEHTPRTRVADAVRISMSIPLFFAAVRDFRDDVYVDGGLFNNYPVKLFDREKYIDDADMAGNARKTKYYNAENKRKPPKSSRYVYNKETLGFRLDTKQEIAIFRDGAQPPQKKIEDFFDYSLAIFGAVMNVQNSQHLHSDDWHRTIYIDTLDVDTTDFDLSDAKKKKLVREGVKGVTKYFKWYDKPPAGETPANK